MQVLGGEGKVEREDEAEVERDIEALKAITSTRPAMGLRREADRQPKEIVKGGQLLRRVFKILVRLGLDELHTIDWDRVTFRRVSSG